MVDALFGETIMRFSMKMPALAGVAAGFLVAAPVFAHHSFATFDDQKTVTLDGTVKEFQWSNPHSWIQIVVKDDSGNDVEWSVEGGSPSQLSRAGWKRKSLQAGDKATVVIHPLRDGTHGGSLVKAVVGGVEIGAGT